MLHLVVQSPLLQLLVWVLLLKQVDSEEGQLVKLGGAGCPVLAKSCALGLIRDSVQVCTCEVHKSKHVSLSDHGYRVGKDQLA